MDNISGFERYSEKENNVQTKCTFVELLITLKQKSKVSDRKRNNLVQLVIRTTDTRNGRLRNIFDVNLKITCLQNF